MKGRIMASSVLGKTCPFCLFPIKQEAEAVHCQSCLVPHHRECWEENRGCTTFGCKETRCKTQQNRIELSIETQGQRQARATGSSVNAFLFIALSVAVIVIVVLSIQPAAMPTPEVVPTPKEDTETSTKQQTSSEFIEKASEVKYYVITPQGRNLFIRKSPGRDNKSDSDIITRVPRGTEMGLVNNHKNSVKKDGYTWWEIRVIKTGVSGWVAAEYISTNASDVFRE